MSLIFRRLLITKSLFLRKSLVSVTGCQTTHLFRHYSPYSPYSPVNVRPVVPLPAQKDKKYIELRVLKSLGKYHKIDLNSISVESDFSRDLGLDSLDLIGCLVQLEDEFQMKFNKRQMDSMTSIRAVVELIAKQMSERVDQNQKPNIDFKVNPKYHELLTQKRNESQTIDPDLNHQFRFVRYTFYLILFTKIIYIAING